MEAERWEELFVTYGRGARGELHIEAVEHERAELPPQLAGAAWPGPDTRTNMGGSGIGPYSAVQRRIDAQHLRPLLPATPTVGDKDD